MSIDLKKLENVSEKPDGKTTARCPACALEGGDKKGEHLVVFRGGKFGCIKYEGDAAHRNKIHSLAGAGHRRVHTPVKLTVKPFQVPEPAVVTNLGSFPRFSRDIKRQWPPIEHTPLQSSEPPSKENPQMELPLMRDVSCEVVAATGMTESGHNNEKSVWVTSNFLNVPPRRVGVSLPALPPNPMKNQM
jgi:hypothetical protein